MLDEPSDAARLSAYLCAAGCSLSVLPAASDDARLGYCRWCLSACHESGASPRPPATTGTIRETRVSRGYRPSVATHSTWRV